MHGRELNSRPKPTVMCSDNRKQSYFRTKKKVHTGKINFMFYSMENNFKKKL
jgi:uncharacterized protein YlaI